MIFFKYPRLDCSFNGQWLSVLGCTRTDSAHESALEILFHPPPLLRTKVIDAL